MDGTFYWLSVDKQFWNGMEYTLVSFDGIIIGSHKQVIWINRFNGLKLKEMSSSHK